MILSIVIGVVALESKHVLELIPFQQDVSLMASTKTFLNFIIAMYDVMHDEKNRILTGTAEHIAHGT